MLIFRFFSAITLVVLSSCADFAGKADQAKAADVSVKVAEPKEKSLQKLEKTSIDPDVLFMLMTAELAGQRGQFDIAIEGYTEAAKHTHDPKLAERAAMIAMYIKDGYKTNEAVTLWLSLDSKSLTARKIAALSALKIGDKQAAAEHLKTMLAVDVVGFEAALQELAGVLQKEGKVGLLYDVLDVLANQSPGQAEIYFMQSLLAMQMNDKALAERKIQQALDIHAGWDKALMFQAQIPVFSGDLAKAKALLKDAVNKYPSNAKISKMLAQVYIKSQEYEAALDVYQGLLAINAKDWESLFAEALIYYQLDKNGKAEAIFESLMDQPEWKFQALFYRGKLAEKQGDNKQALIWFDKVEEGSLLFDASVAGISILAKDKRFEEADSRITQLLSRFPKQRPQLILVQAELYNQQKQYERAFNVLTDALLDFPDQKELLYTRALIAERLDKTALVEADLKKILAVEPDNVESLNALGYTLLNQPTRYADAELFLQRAINLEPNSAVVIDSYGWLQFKLGRTEKALSYLQQAYEKQQESEIASHLIEVLSKLGRQNEAKSLLDKAISEAPNDEYLLNVKRKLFSGTAQ
ncbi:MAG: tetratricopeptide repeat protein [Methylococcales bacterium]